MLKYIALFIAVMLSQHSMAQKREKSYPDYLSPQHAINTVTMVMVHDVVGPPIAARYYAYCMLGAYNIVAARDKQYPAINKVVKSFSATLVPDTLNKPYDYRIAAYYSILESARLLLPSGYTIKDDEGAFVTLLLKVGIKKEVIDNSVAIAEKASQQVLAYSKTDRYGLLSSLQRYTPLKEDGKWYPTPPGYFEALEPNWRTIRTMVIDTSTQFKPAPLIAFSKDTASAFHQQVVAVYKASKVLTDDQINQALFWDCNPFAITTSGHMSIGYKKISPGGHWMHIAGLVAKQAKLNFNQSVVILTLEGITIMDAFISCWEEKFASNRIRPETYINRYMDVNWRPILQTPPFPEYTSGHAVVSHASAEVLTYLLGDNFKYDDDTEIPFGSGKRSFTSFRQAAKEASMSRFYGGIHYFDSINNGNAQGKAVAGYIISKAESAGIKPFTKAAK